MSKRFFILSAFLLFMFSCRQKVETKVENITISASKSGNTFEYGSLNGVLRLTARASDENGEEKKTDFEWSSNLPESIQKNIDKNVFMFSIDDIDTLGDYEISCKAEDKTSVYRFSVDTSAELSEQLVYAVACVASLQENKTYLSVSEEYNPSNMKKIEDSDDRLSLGESFSFTPTGSNILHISSKDKNSFGKLSLTTENIDMLDGFDDFNTQTDEFGQIIYNGQIAGFSDGEGGLFLYTGKIKDEEKEVSVSVNAGNKKSYSSKITLKVSQDKSLPKPTISEKIKAKTAGHLYDITGNAVSNGYYRSEGYEGLYTLSVAVYRKSRLSDEYEVYDYKSNIETKEIQFGEEIHLAHEGEYIITAKVICQANASESGLVYKGADGGNFADGFTGINPIAILPRPLSSYSTYLTFSSNPNFTNADFANGNWGMTAGDFTSFSTENYNTLLNDYAVSLDISSSFAEKVKEWNVLNTGKIIIEHSPYSRDAGFPSNENYQLTLSALGSPIEIQSLAECRTYYDGLSEADGEHTLFIYPEDTGEWYGNIVSEEKNLSALSSYIYQKKYITHNDHDDDISSFVSIETQGEGANKKYKLVFDKESIFDNDYLKEKGHFAVKVYQSLNLNLLNTSYASSLSKDYTYNTLDTLLLDANNGTNGYFYEFAFYRYAETKGDINADTYEVSYPSSVYATRKFYEPLSLSSASSIAVKDNLKNPDEYRYAYVIKRTKDGQNTERSYKYAFTANSSEPSVWNDVPQSNIIYSPNVCSFESCYNNTVLTNYYLHIKEIPTANEASFGVNPTYKGNVYCSAVKKATNSSLKFDSSCSQSYYNGRQAKGVVPSGITCYYYISSSSSKPSYSTFNNSKKGMINGSYLYEGSNRYVSSTRYVHAFFKGADTDEARGWCYQYLGSFYPKSFPNMLWAKISGSGSCVKKNYFYGRCYGNNVSDATVYSCIGFRIWDWDRSDSHWGYSWSSGKHEYENWSRISLISGTTDVEITACAKGYYTAYWVISKYWPDDNGEWYSSGWSMNKSPYTSYDYWRYEGGEWH